MSIATITWVLNLDADLELAAPDRGTPSARHRHAIQTQASRFLSTVRESLPRCEHRALATETMGPAPVTRSTSAGPVVSWCPTPTAVRQAAETGAVLTPGPSLDVLRTVNHRRFSSSLSPGLPGSGFVDSVAQLQVVLAASTPASGWLMKRPHGFSGRGRKRVPNLDDPAARRWVEASMSDYGLGLQVEPFVEVTQEFALHGLLNADGTTHRGHPTELSCDGDGAYLGSHRAAQALTEEEASALSEAFDRTAAALTSAGYFGPFGIDAFRWQDASGPRFHPLSEVNARYTMGFFCGFAAREEEWLTHLAQHATPHR